MCGMICTMTSGTVKGGKAVAISGITSKRLQAVLIGGNHLASSLAKFLDADFAVRFPPKSDPETVRADILAEGAKTLGDGTVLYDMWVAWAAIQNARHLMGDRAKPDKVWERCPGCKGKGKVPLVVKIDDREPASRGRQVACPECKGQGRKAVAQ